MIVGIRMFLFCGLTYFVLKDVTQNKWVLIGWLLMAIVAALPAGASYEVEKRVKRLEQERARPW